MGFIALVIPGIILTIMFSLAFPVLLIENKGVFGSMGRSRKLVGHRWLKTFATFLVFAIIFGIASAIVGAISGATGVASPVVNGILSAFYQPLFPILLVVYYYSNVARIAPPNEAQMPTAVAAGTELKFCPACGTRLDSQVIFCPNCGTRLN